MKIPNRLKIGESEYHVSFIPNLHESDAGSCYQPDKLILISSGQTKKEALATLCHEILHAMEAELNITLGHRKINKMEYVLAEILEQLCSKR